MTARRYTRLQLASAQLESAIALFITGRDRFSVITLAGAADTILAQLVLKSGRDNFTDALIALDQSRGEAQGATRQSFGRAINDMLFINALKHFDEGEDIAIEIDPEGCALAAILKAVANYVDLDAHDESLVNAFRLWMQKNLDPAKYNVHSNPNWKPGLAPGSG